MCRFQVFGIALFWLLSFSESLFAEPVLRAGFAEQDITPAAGSERPGGYTKSYLKSVHDPCKVRACVFEGSSELVALVSVDALALRREFVLQARSLIQKRCKIKEEHILISASHSHSGGPVFGVFPGEYDNAPEIVKDLAYKHSPGIDPKYYKKVLNAVVTAVCNAKAKLSPALCSVGIGIAKGVAFNRRFLMKNGRTFTHPGQGNPDIVKPAGPVDPEVGVLGVWKAANRRPRKLLGCIVNFACHATTNPGGFSANYIYYIEKVIRGFFGKQVVVLFFPGACGDVTQVDNTSPYARRTGEEEAELVGGKVGAEALKVLISQPRGELKPVRAVSRVLKVKRRSPSEEHMNQAWRIIKAGPKKAGRTAWIFAKEKILLSYLLSRSPKADLEIQAVQIGPVLFISNPAELFCELGIRIKKKSPFPFTFPVTLANGCVGYVPTKEAFGPNGGGYETRLTSYSNLDIGCGDLIVKTSSELARSLAPGKAPARPKAPPFSSPWSYGNVPPEVD